MNSYTKIIIKNNVRIYISDFKKVTQDIISIHKYTPFASLILANGITAFGPLGFLYDIEKVSVLMKTNGAMKSFVLEFKNKNIRALLGDGTVTTEFDLNGLYNNIPLILGIGDEGLVRVSRFTNNGTPYTSEVPLANGDMITDLAYYLNKSDQVFSAIINDVYLNVKDYLKVDKAKSIIFQLLPNHSEKDIIWIENLIKNNDFKKTTIEKYIELINGNEIAHSNVNFKCSCSSVKMKNVIKLLSLNDKEISENNKKEKIEIKCDFCLKIMKINLTDI